MTTAEEYANEFAADLEIAEGQRDRSQQTHHRLLGVSDLHHCREYGRLFLSGHPFTDTPETSQARAGTYYHAGVLPAIAAARPGSLIEQEVSVTLANGFEVIGHADLIEPDEPSVTDVKTVDGGLAAVRRTGATMQQRSQRHLYYAGAHQAGLVPPEGTVRNIWLDRSGTPQHPHVEQEPYDAAWLDKGAAWVDEVMHHVEDDTPASRDKDYHFCRDFCAFFTACRGEQAEPPEELTDPTTITAAALYREGVDLEREGRELKEAARQQLDGANGVAGGLRVRSTWIGPSEVAYTRKGYTKLSVERIKAAS